MNFGKSKIFLLFCVSFITGVFLGKWTSYYFIAVAAMFFIAAITLGWRKKWWMVAGFAGLILLAGAWRWQQSFNIARAENFVGNHYGQKVEWEGVVVRDPDVRSDKIYLTVQPAGYAGRVLLRLGRYPEYAYGDKLKIAGKLEEPFESEEFSYKNYLSRYDTYAVVYFPKVEKTGQGQGSAVTASLLRFKHRLQRVIAESLPEPHASLLLGIILGLKRSLPEQLTGALAATGVSHIIVISGYNISIIVKSLLRTRVALGRRAAFVLALSGILGLVIMTGAEASVVRAAVMGFALIAASGAGRIYQAQNAVIFAGAAMIAQNPRLLQFDIGFQLSFAATLGLIYLSPVFEKWLRKVPDFLLLRTNLCSSAAAILATLPLLSYYFGRVSIVALPVNVLVLWVVPYIMILGVAVSFLGLVYLPAARLAGSLAWVLLSYVIWVVETAARLPFAAVAVKMGAALSAVYYLLLASSGFLYRKKKGFRYYLEYVETKI